MGKGVLPTDIKEGRPSFVSDRGQSMVAGLAYCVASMTMVLMNKYVLTGFDFHYTNSLLLSQTLLSVVLVVACAGAGLVKLEPLTMPIVKLWAPANIIFVGMIMTGFFSIKHLSVPMVTVLKNFTNIFVVCGDIYFFKRRPSPGVWWCLALIFISGLCSGITDLQFSVEGYAWQFANCVFTASYALYLRRTMDVVKPLTRTGELNQFSMVYFNNLLCTPLILLLMWYFGELPGVLEAPQLRSRSFQVAVGISGCVGFAISLASLWFLQTTTATVYSLVGSLNKIPTSILGILMFNTPTTWQNLASIGLGLAAGIAFTRAKSASSKKDQK
jgi:GDP-mannose transporter|uniref:Sugar phosphate transporter domain-containing protein n=1 Tax=Prasinoderma singulare TaxID=676789 RepID=A0A7S3BTQ5_9VIRI